MILRKAAQALSSQSIISDEGDGKIRIHTSSTLKSANIVFVLGQEIDEATMDGRKCKVCGSTAS